MDFRSNASREITTWPEPFKEDATPYHSQDFGAFSKSYADRTVHRMTKMIVLGNVSVGKTALIHRFCKQIFSTCYKATIGVDFEVEHFHILNSTLTLQIWDTAGQERFKCIAQSYYRGAHAIVLVFDVNNLYSLACCKKWLREAREAGNDDSLVFLVGTKRDLVSPAVYESTEKLATDAAYDVSAEYWCVSAKTGQSVVSLFRRIAALAFEKSINADVPRFDDSLVPTYGYDLVSFKKNKLKKKGKADCANCKNIA